MTVNESHMTAEGWHKTPSVTYGGKAYFWFRRVGSVRQWLMWSRESRTWEYSQDDMSRPGV